MSKIFLRLIEFYQRFLSFDRGILMILAPGGACKYPVSCSQYTKQMIINHGAFKGLLFGVRRVISCR